MTPVTETYIHSGIVQRAMAAVAIVPVATRPRDSVMMTIGTIDRGEDRVRQKDGEVDECGSGPAS